MPIFEYECPKHGVFERLVASWQKRKNKVRCGCCARLSVLVPSLTSMQPDDSWHTGVHVAALDKTFDSKKQMKQALRESGIAQAEPGHKVTKNTRAADVARRLHVEKHLEGYAP